jgi:hypothetical protein
MYLNTNFNKIDAKENFRSRVPLGLAPEFALCYIYLGDGIRPNRLRNGRLMTPIKA